MLRIEDNYIDAEKCLDLRLMMESDIFPWFFLQGKVTKKDKLFDYQFVHIFYKNYSINSDYYERLSPLIDKLKPLSLIRIKANLNPVSNELIKFDKHQDQFFKCKTAIYYLNDNNGYTMIGDKKVESKSNRMVFFDADQTHYGTNSTNCNNRMVINFNYV
tara:strand:+ start:294 stop:773 length:480 start_codon:yes stop_codon:yes gene_type:complete